jgi:hypothetical protein
MVLGATRTTDLPWCDGVVVRASWCRSLDVRDRTTGTPRGTMMATSANRLHSLEGRLVDASLADGRRLAGSLVSSGGARLRNLWLFVDGEDVFVALDDVVEITEAQHDAASAA